MATYGSAWGSFVQILQNTGYDIVPVEGLLCSDFTVTIRKAGGTFAEKVLTTQDLMEVGDGWYEFKWSTGDMDTLGEFYFRAVPDVPGAFPVDKIFDVNPPPLYMQGVHPDCIVTGNIINIGGMPSTNTYVMFRPKSVPVIAGTSLLGATVLRTTPDAFGNFSVRLLRNLQVLVEIEGAGIRHLITVPDMDTASIIDLLPPVPPPL